MIESIIPACLVVIILVLLFYKPFWMISILQKAFSNVVFFVKTDLPFVALTLDDGPDDSVSPVVLSILNDENIPSTWFVVGRYVEKYPKIYREISESNHQVANHLWSHTPFITTTKKHLFADIERTENLIMQQVSPKLIRPPATVFFPWMLGEFQRRGYRLVLGSIYAGDVWGAPSSYLRWIIPKLARPGSIIVLHVGIGRDRTGRVLKDIIHSIKRKGLTFVTLEQLLASENK